jgi:hypothetical protein
MKHAFFLVVALLAGLVLGSWSVKTDLRNVQKENEKLKEELKQRGGRPGSMQGIATMLRIPDTHRPVTKPVGIEVGVSTDNASTNLAKPPEKSPQEQIKAAMELWKTRSALARNSFLSNLDATPEQTQHFDETVNTMNQQLGEKIKTWAEMIKQQDQVPPEAGVRMISDLSKTLVSAYDGMDKTLPQDWRDKAGPEFQLFDFINPEVALPMAGYKGKWSGGFGNRKGP